MLSETFADLCTLWNLGTWSIETETSMEELVIENVRSALEKGKLVTPVPEQADL